MTYLDALQIVILIDFNLNLMMVESLILKVKTDHLDIGNITFLELDIHSTVHKGFGTVPSM